MDLNADGKLDILSGSYSRQSKDMAGLFQVLWGTGDGFKTAEVLNGADGEPLIITAAQKGDNAVIDQICTRPFAADLDGDGNLDIVAGNFTGTFAFFRGLPDGEFEPKNSWLEHGSSPLRVNAHSDPFLIDWDNDGDLDLLSGASAGGAFLFRNEGSSTEPKWGAKTTLLAEHGHAGMNDDIVFGDEHVKGPQGATRIWADDIDGDGRLDLLLGDMLTLKYPAKGLDEQTARKKYAKWQERFQAMMNKQGNDGAPPDGFQKLWEEQEKIVRSEMTGHVWLLRQVPAGDEPR